MMASEKPRSSITIASRMYITPMRLWSTLVIHSRHKYGRCPLMTTQPRMPRMPSATTPEAIIGIGCSRGIASQLSLPSIGGLRLQRSTFDARLGSRRRRQFLRDDRCENIRIGQAVNRRCVLHRRLGNLLIALRIKRLLGVRGVLRPFRKLLCRYDVNVEMHVRESVAAELGRQALQRPDCIRPQ